MADSRLQASPIGLLGAFDLKIGGENPSRFSEAVQPGLEILGFYGVKKRTFLLATGNLQNAGDELLLTVPAGVVWRVLAVSGRAVLTSADVMGFIGMIGVRPTSNTAQALTIIAERQIVQPAAPVAIHASVCAGLPEPLYLGPGGQFSLYLAASFAAARSCSIQAHVEAYEL